MSIETVLGPIEPKKLGKTLTHEHIRLSYTCCFAKPPMEHHMKRINENFIKLENLGFVRQYPYSHIYNLAFRDETLEDMIAEVKLFKEMGGDSIVEVTTEGIEPDYEFLREVSKGTGVNIICCTGYYLGHTLSDEVKNASVDDLVKNMVQDLKVGRNGIKAGVIGEVGLQYPMAVVERKSLIASGKAQAEMKCPLIIHPGRAAEAPYEIIDVLREAGADISKTVISHLDRTLRSCESLLKFAAYSDCYLEFDLFGIEVSHYQFGDEIDFPSDAQRVEWIKALVDGGYGDRVVIAHDIHTRHRLSRYGGHGYGHILENVVPKMLARGIAQDAIDKMLIENPKRWLTW
ncbi:phosphotriesterase-related protein-like [Clytia hemisphaerica]|uniref:Parathion hydrolase-related protein n=1 Tax=Clytia hemisphaerica TaxID=252671 RepID=A0A7M5UR00_9CNID